MCTVHSRGRVSRKVRAEGAIKSSVKASRIFIVLLFHSHEEGGQCIQTIHSVLHTMATMRNEWSNKKNLLQSIFLAQSKACTHKKYFENLESFCAWSKWAKLIFVLLRFFIAWQREDMLQMCSFIFASLKCWWWWCCCRNSYIFSWLHHFEMCLYVCLFVWFGCLSVC